MASKLDEARFSEYQWSKTSMITRILSTLLGLLIGSWSYTALAQEYVYDLKAECGLYFHSSHKFSIPSPQERMCILLQEDSEDGIEFMGAIFPLESTHIKQWLPDKDKRGDLEIYQRYKSVAIEKNGIIQEAIQVTALNKTSKDRLIVTRLRFTKPCDKASIKYKKCQEDQERFTELQECWDGIFFSDMSKVAMRVEALCSHHDDRRSQQFASLDSWQAKLIKSMVLATTGESHSSSLKPKPSFDCAKASSQAEKTICADAVLSRLDAALSTNYRDKALSGLGKSKTRFTADQRAWFKQRNTCKTADCLRKSYILRIGQICNDYPVRSANPPTCITAEKALSADEI
jgi:uncharacterized protein YecT (DUF1311 family)